MPSPDRRRQNPSAILYWNDLRNDPKLRRCSPAAKGLWAVHMLPAAAESPEYGVVVIDGAPSRQQDLGEMLCREIGENAETTQALVDELVRTGTASVDEQGRVFNRRMAREESIRHARSIAGKLGADVTNAQRQKSGKGVGKHAGKGGGKQGSKAGSKQGGKTLDDKQPEIVNAATLSNGHADALVRQTASNGVGKSSPSSLPSLPSLPSLSVAKATGAEAPPAGLDLKAALFTQGVDWLQTVTKKPNPQCRALIGKWRQKLGDNVLLDLLLEAQRQNIQGPEGWFTAAIKRHEQQGTTGVMPKNADEAMEQFRTDPAWRGVAA